jgi:hypothetical protein
MDEDKKPTMTETEVWEWLHYDEGIPVTRHAIKYAVLNRDIVPTRLGNRNFFSKCDGWDFVASQKAPTATRFTGASSSRGSKTRVAQ